MEHMEVVVDVKGPGQVVGEVFMQEAPPPCRYSARARGDVLALKLTQENYVRALAAMMYEAENGARATAHSSGASRGQPLPSMSAGSLGMLGLRSAAPAAAGGGAGGAPAPVGSAGTGQAQAQGSSSITGPGASSEGGSRSRTPTGIVPGGYSSQGGSLSPSSAVAVAAGGAGAGAAAGRGAAALSMQSSTCGSLASTKETAGHLSSSAPMDSSTAPLSVLAATNTSSSGSIVGRGAHASPYRTSGPLVGERGGAGSTADDSGPIKFIGSGDATDDEGTDVQHQHVRLPQHQQQEGTSTPPATATTALLPPSQAVEAAVDTPAAAAAAALTAAGPFNN